MTDEAINIAIAEACGARQCPIHHGWECCGQIVRNYVADLNAMAQAEDALKDDDERLKYSHELACTCTPKDNNAYRSNLQWALVWTWIRATARNRAEAWLRTKGLWKEEK